MKRTTLTLALPGGPMDVSAYVVNRLAIHRALGYDPKDAPWAMTHIPSGLGCTPHPPPDTNSRSPWSTRPWKLRELVRIAEIIEATCTRWPTAEAQWRDCSELAYALKAAREAVLIGGSDAGE